MTSKYIQLLYFILIVQEVSAVEEKTASKPMTKLTATQEMTVTVHHTENGPSLEACMIAILSSYMSKTDGF